MVIVGKKRVVLIDCVSNPILRLKKAGVDFCNLTDLILTHFHPDHTFGISQLLMNMWLMGHRQPLNLYGLDYTVDRVKKLMGLYGWSEWPDFFPVVFFRLPLQEMVPLLECDEFRIIASPVQHLLPTIGLRVEFVTSNKILAYSCDTEPCPQVLRLAAGADVLLHEASGALKGHSSAAQAGEVAQQAGVRELFLIHYPTGKYSSNKLVSEARKRFDGVVHQAEDFLELNFN